MATFFENLRASADQSNPENSATTFRLPIVGQLSTSGVLGQDNGKRIPNGNDFIREFQSAFDDTKGERAEIEKQIKETAPMRDAIRNISGGRILVDSSIYDKKELGRLYDTIKTMQDQNDGALPPGYTVISNGGEMGSSLGSAAHRRVRQHLYGFEWQFPRDNYGGKNAPYRVKLSYANDTELNDALARDAAESGWTIENFSDGDIKSATHSHELAHTAYFDALKKTQSPALTLNDSEKKKREDFMNTHTSLQEIFDTAARNTGYDTVADAASSISRYALNDAKADQSEGGLDQTKNWRPEYMRLPELFAEAYSDVLHNKDNASSYAKEIIRLYKNYVKDYNKTFNDKIELNAGLSTPKLGENKFADNWQKSFR